MGDKNVLMWLFLLSCIVLCAYWHRRENRELTRSWQKNLDPANADFLRRFAWSRTIQLLAGLVCLTFIIIIYDWQLSDARVTIRELNKNVTESAQRVATPAPATTASRLPAQAIAPNSNRTSYAQQRFPAGTVSGFRPNISTPTQPVNNSYYPPAVSSPQTPQPVAVPVQRPMTPAAASPNIGLPVVTLPEVRTPTQLPPSATVTTAPTVSDVYNPEKQGTDNQSAMDGIKKRYEDILVTYMFLKKCGRVDPNDYHIITSALGQDMASINAPGRMQYDIQTAASGSYNEMYSKSSCDGIDQLYKQYADYIRAISNNVPPQ